MSSEPTTTIDEVRIKDCLHVMKICHLCLVLLVAGSFSGCAKPPQIQEEIAAIKRGPHAVGSTNLEVSPEYAEIGDEQMHEILVGNTGEPGFLADVLKHPESAWITDVPIPDKPDMYGPASGETLQVVTFLTYPSGASGSINRYEFPYHDASYGAFEDMLAPHETPIFADPNKQYPLIVLAHGASAHGLYDIEHAHSLASHGYIVAVISYGDNRLAQPNDLNHHVSFLRPLLTRAVVDDILENEDFSSHVDADNIGVTGHSLGGFTALAVAGGPYLGNTDTVSDPRIRAAAVAAPWVGGTYDGNELFAFGPDNAPLSRVTIPVITFFGTSDDVTLASYILPATKRLSGPSYVIELVGQPHVFEPGSWADRNAWELLFFDAYLKHDSRSLTMLNAARSASGGNEDYQLLDYQRLHGSH